MTFPWREQPTPLLEQHFNPRVAVPHFQEALARYAARSAAARQRLPGVYDLRYGTRPQQTFDLHRVASSLSAPPLVLFLHGGYWRALDKRDHSFVAFAERHGWHDSLRRSFATPCRISCPDPPMAHSVWTRYLGARSGAKPPHFGISAQ